MPDKPSELIYEAEPRDLYCEGCTVWTTDGPCDLHCKEK